ncbi:MAG: DASS family sodium-coupled anion symporter [Planctomycetota bacterium]|nr:DASS family sodium-coupled anion symporter [Planctomycetota bacterium]
MTTEPSLHGQTTWITKIGFWLGLVLFLLVFVIPGGEDHVGIPPDARKVAAVTLLCAIWWITQPIPIPATSLIPLVLFPILGVSSAGDTAKAYAHDLIMLLMGGFFISQAIQKCGLHRRIALRVIASAGRQPAMIVFGFMLATALLSMWISNTATCLMLLPIALAIISQVSKANPDDPAGSAALGTALMLGIAYAANVGGIGTPIGTPPNVIFLAQFSEKFPDAPPITFPQWMAYTLPLVALFIPIIWFLLVRVLCPIPKGLSTGKGDLIEEEIRKLGPMTVPERRVLYLFAVTAFLWIFRADIQLGEEGLRLPGIVTWLHRLGLPERITEARFVGDGTVAVFMAIIFFLVPTQRGSQDRLLDWKSASKIPWGLLLLFGGGLAIAHGFDESGLSEWFGERLTILGDKPTIVMIGADCLLLTFMTEITSNTAVTAVMMPILADLSSSIGVNPILLMMPAAISASFAFMLPVGTGPNAVVYSSGLVPIGRMAKAGVILNIIGVILVTGYIYLVMVVIKGM